MSIIIKNKLTKIIVFVYMSIKEVKGMAVKKLNDKEDGQSAILRVTIPKVLLKKIRDTKKRCKEKNLSFDIKPDVRIAIENAIKEAEDAINNGL